MNIKELRAKNDAELLKDIAAMQEQTRELRFKMHSQEVKNVKSIAVVRKNIARIRTLLGERARQEKAEKKV